MKHFKQFNADQIKIINNSAAIAEELVSNFYKISESQWLHHRYDIKTLIDLKDDEIVHGPFAQVIRYKARKTHTSLGSSMYDFYKICFQDHSILLALQNMPKIELFPFSLYITTHELIHIVRFGKFLQNFDASPKEKMAEEMRVNEKTHEILSSANMLNK